jgi:hypothetical protein
LDAARQEMLPYIVALFPLGAAAGLALLLAAHTLVLPFELVGDGKCLTAEGRFAPCAAGALRLYNLGGVVRADGLEGCLTRTGSLGPCAWSTTGRWLRHKAALCNAAGFCLGKQTFGNGAVLTTPAHAAIVRFVSPPSQLPEARAIFEAATFGAAIVMAAMILLLFCEDMLCWNSDTAAALSAQAASQPDAAKVPPGSDARGAGGEGGKPSEAKVGTTSPEAMIDSLKSSSNSGDDANVVVAHRSSAAASPAAVFCQQLGSIFGAKTAED